MPQAMVHGWTPRFKQHSRYETHSGLFSLSGVLGVVEDSCSFGAQAQSLIHRVPSPAAVFCFSPRKSYRFVAILVSRLC